ncbi:Protein CBG05425 [Caenorhabditis briggsae]|uniref:Protein CBG05425 n=1 Tax=Caenorhabditis briggsae TaxID=6238 RepID=A8WZU6_CAEBR|nr:Protein CBG05425 [Caenorhabditis briggsae]CAP25906.2 Protein CBG05425 [Caenorhabditis briggsae]
MTGIAEKHHTTVSSVILTWIVQSGNGVAVKSKSIERVSENFKVPYTIQKLNLKLLLFFQSTTLQLTDEEMVKIKELDLSTPYVEDRGWEVV